MSSVVQDSLYPLMINESLGWVSQTFLSQILMFHGFTTYEPRIMFDLMLSMVQSSILSTLLNKIKLQRQYFATMFKTQKTGCAGLSLGLCLFYKLTKKWFTAFEALARTISC